MVIATLVVVSAIISYLLNGWVLSILWGWFMVPVLGLPELSLVQAIGIAIVIGMLTHQSFDDTQTDSRGRDWVAVYTTQIFASIIYPVLALCIGWIVQLFM